MPFIGHRDSPNDPRLSGYAISYYYFGYMLVAMIMHVTGTVSGIAFNLSVSLWFALITITSAGLLFNLISAKKVEAGPNNENFTDTSVKSFRAIDDLVDEQRGRVFRNVARKGDVLAYCAERRRYLGILALAGYPGINPRSLPAAQVVAKSD